MKILNYINTLTSITSMLHKEKTGTATDIGKKLHLSSRSIHHYMDELRSLGAEIEWDQMKNTYYLKNSFDLEFRIKV